MTMARPWNKACRTAGRAPVMRSSALAIRRIAGFDMPSKMVKTWVVLHFQAARNAGHTDGVGNCVTWQMPLSRPGSSFRVCWAIGPGHGQ